MLKNVLFHYLSPNIPLHPLSLLSFSLPIFFLNPTSSFLSFSLLFISNSTFYPTNSHTPSNYFPPPVIFYLLFSTSKPSFHFLSFLSSPLSLSFPSQPPQFPNLRKEEPQPRLHPLYYNFRGQFPGPFPLLRERKQVSFLKKLRVMRFLEMIEEEDKKGKIGRSEIIGVEKNK